MDIKSGCGYPASALSNFAPHPFVFDGVECASMEGLLQAFKSPYPHIQVEICKLVGIGAKRRGSKIDWKKKQMLYWQGKGFARDSEAYQYLLSRAYAALFVGSESFRNALKASGKSVLKHSIGRTDPKETVLTQSEFCSRLMYLRDSKLVDSVLKGK
jgi:hypothetical protein